MSRAPHRFYYAGHVDPQHSSAAPVELSPEESHHLLRVLRLAAGAQVDLFDAAGNGWSAEVAPSAPGDAARVRLVSPLPQAETAPGVNLAICVLKHRGMDLLLEKLSELGVATLQPLLSARTVVQTDAAGSADTAAGAASHPQRWDRIVLAVAKQCGRNRALDILPPLKLKDWLGRTHPPGHAAFAHGAAQAQPLGAWLRETAQPPLPRWIAIGPEGGWTPAEAEAFIESGFQPVTLGMLTLRAETAAIAVASAALLA